MSRTLLGGVEAGEEIGRDGPGDEVGTRVSTTLDTKPECAVCEGLQAGLTTSDENGNEKAREYRASPGILKEHALKGCLGCKLIYDGYQMFKDESDGRTWWALQLSWKSPEEGTTLRVRLMPASIYAEGYCFLLKEGSTSPWSAVKHIREGTVLEEPRSSQGLKKIQSWIANCEESHPRCMQGNSRLPKRVLDVGLAVGNTNIHLYESENEVARYITLSYCWGPPALHPLKTFATNIKARKASIPWTELGKTFRDAIWLTQSLGLRYLWIDSLCIIQDDEADWREQSADMCQVYEGSYLTIAATRASSVDDGCFGRQIDLKAITPGILARFDYNHSIWGLAGRLNQDLSSNPLLYRGWCFQERLLSARVLHFAAQEMVFECRSGVSCECMHEYKVSKDMFASMSAAPPSTTPLKTQFYEEETWPFIVLNYSITRLTRHSDILEALSGTAKSFSLRHNKTYLAGLWMEDLPESLLWESLRNCHRPTTYTAPSFSWASRIGVLKTYSTFPPNSKRFCVSIVKGECETSTLNPLGTVFDGYLTLRGSLLLGSLKRYTRYNGSIATELTISAENIFGFGEWEFLRKAPNSSHVYKTTEVNLDTEEDWLLCELPQSVYGVPVMTLGPSSLTYYCLILMRNGDGNYRRIGMAVFQNQVRWDLEMHKTEFTIV